MAVNAEKLVMDWLNADPTIKAEYPAMFDVPAGSSANRALTMSWLSTTRVSTPP